MQIRIALLSPNKNAYSESFIQRHKNLIHGKIFYFYGGFLPFMLEGKGSLISNNWFRSILINVGRTFLGVTQFDKEFQLCRYLKKCKINLVFAEYGPTAAHCLAICKRLQLPLIVHFHGFDASHNETLNEYRKQYGRVFKYASAIICVSDTMYQDLRNIGCPEGKIHKILYRPEESFLNIESTYTSENFFSATRFVDKKAPYYVILSFSKVLTQFPNATLTIAGDGPLLNACKNISSFLGISANITFLGASDRRTIITCMKNSCAYVQHSIIAESGDKEGTPVAIIEAMAAGLPVVSTFHAGIAELVKHNEHGYLVNEHDVCGMTKYMLKILGDKEKTYRMSKRVKYFANNNLHSNSDIKQINQLIQLTLKNQPV